VSLVAVISGVVAVFSAIAGMLLAIRAARTKERRAAEAEIEELGTMLAKERQQRIWAERRAYDAQVILAQHGLEGPHEPN